MVDIDLSLVRGPDRIERSRSSGPGSRGAGPRSRQRHEVSAPAARGRPERIRRLGGQSGVGERAAGVDGRGAPLRAHDVQRDAHDRDEGHRPRPRNHQPTRCAESADPRRGRNTDRTTPPGADRQPQGPRKPVGRTLPASGRVRQIAHGTARADHQGPIRPDLHFARSFGPERIHVSRPDALHDQRSGEQAGAVVLDGVRPTFEPGLPGVLQRAGRGPGRAATAR